MKNNTGYTFNHVAKEIIITKAFDKAARNINSREYNDLSTLVRDFPTYKIVLKTIERNVQKKSYTGLTIAEMKEFFSETRTELEKKTFDKVLDMAEGTQGKYAVIKKWFLAEYKEAYNKYTEEKKLLAQFNKMAAEMAAEVENEEESESLEEE